MILMKIQAKLRKKSKFENFLDGDLFRKSTKQIFFLFFHLKNTVRNAKFDCEQEYQHFFETKFFIFEIFDFLAYYYYRLILPTRFRMELVH